MGGVVYDVNKELRDMTPDERERMRLDVARSIIVPEFIPPSKMGAPTKYTEDMPQRVYDMLSNTTVMFTQKLVAAHLHINVSTLKEWKSVNPDLSSAIAQGLAVQEAWLATLMAGGMKYSASIYAVLKNLHDWSDKIESRTTLDLTEAIRKQASGAKRVQWDKAQPDTLRIAAPQPTPHAQPRDHAPTLTPDTHALPTTPLTPPIPSIPAQ